MEITNVGRGKGAVENLRIKNVLAAVSDLDGAAAWFESEFGLASLPLSYPDGTGTRMIDVGAQQAIELWGPERAGTEAADRAAALSAGGGRFIHWEVATSAPQQTVTPIGLDPVRHQFVDDAGVEVDAWWTLGPDRVDLWEVPSFMWRDETAPNWGVPDEVPLATGGLALGFAWIEVGGNATAVSNWVGESQSLPIRHISGRQGPHAVGVRTSAGVIEVRLSS